MIRTETLTIGGKQFIRTYSDEGRFVVGGSPVGEYTEAIDPAELNRTYTEGGLMPKNDTVSDEEYALTRYINEQTGNNSPDLVSATETLLKTYIQEA